MSEMISTDESMDEEKMLRDSDAEAELINRTETLPKKSADRYKLVYEAYKKWKSEHESSLSNSEEINLIVYFKELTKRLRPSTLWCTWSMLKKTLNTSDNIDLNKFQNLRSMIKNNSKGYKPKKSSIFKWSEIMKFVNNGSDHTHLGSKVILILGICGALRCNELTKLTVQDVEDLGNKFLVSVGDTKNGLPRQFIIGEHFYQKVKEYTSMRLQLTFTDRFLIQYQNGKFHQQVIGRNKIGETPHLIATFLNLPKAKSYTGHCFRRTGATLLSNSGASTTMLKQLGGWKSTVIAQGYMENSLKNREQIYERITHAFGPDQTQPQPSTSSTANDSRAQEIILKNDETSADTATDSINFCEAFEINEEDLAKIDEPDRREVSNVSPTPSFKIASNGKTLSPGKQPPPPIHFLKKPPITVFQKKTENQPLLNGRKGIQTENQPTPKSLPTNRTVNENPSNIYENCVFHGNIVNNFYHSCHHEKKMMRTQKKQ